MQPVDRVLHRLALQSVSITERRGKQKKFFNKMENITVNIVYKSIRRFREEET